MSKIDEYSFVINKYGYCANKSSLTEEQEKLIKKELLVTPKDNGGYDEVESFKVYSENSDYYFVPRWWGLENLCNKPDIDFPETSYTNCEFDKFKIRPDQMEMASNLIDSYFDFEKCKYVDYQGKFINIRTGGGKTAMALFTMCLLKKRTLIVVHTVDLELQWEQRIDEFVSNVTVGYIQGKEYRIKGCDVVIAKIQSLMKSKLDLRNLLKDFDFIIYDEAHHYCSKVFSNVLKKLPFKYSLALSATIERKDELDKVLHWFLGDIVYKTSGQLDYNVAIDVIKFKINDKKNFKEISSRNKKLNTGKMMTRLTEIKERNDLIVNKVNDMFEKEPERHILLISHRVEQLYTLMNEFEKTHDPSTIGLILGTKSVKTFRDKMFESYKHEYKSMDEFRPVFKDIITKYGIIVVKKKGKLTDQQKNRLLTKKIILGIYNLCKEGLDIVSLCCVFLLTPMSAVLQSCGRMFRRHKSEYIHVPKVIDIRDEISVYVSMSYKRLGEYKEAYLNAPKSTLTYYLCNDSTNFKIVHEYEANLKELQISSYEKVQKSKKENPFDSDSD